MPKGHNFYVKFASKVADGTKCRDGSLDVCIDGKCEVGRPFGFLGMGALCRI